MNRAFWTSITLVVMLATISCSAATQQNASLAFDPGGAFEFWVPADLVFQRNESSDDLLVFYGNDEVELFYVERLGLVLDKDSHQFAERTLEQFASPHGPRQFAVEGSLQEIEVDGRKGTLVDYTFRSSQQVDVQERRIFVIVGQMGYTITYSNQKERFPESIGVLKEILADWRWLNGE